MFVDAPETCSLGPILGMLAVVPLEEHASVMSTGRIGAFMHDKSHDLISRPLYRYVMSIRKVGDKQLVVFATVRRSRMSSTSKAARLRGRAEPARVPTMGPTGEGHDPRPIHETDPVARGHPRHQGYAAQDHTGLHSQVPCTEAPQGAARGPQRGGVPPVSEPARVRGQQLAPQPPKIGGQRMLADCWLPNPQRRDAKIWDDPSAAEDDAQGPGTQSLIQLRQLVLQQQLQNSSHTCYINTSVLASTWQALGSNEFDIPEAWKTQLQKHIWNPMNFLRFSLLRWRNPEQQHDVSEFLSYLLEVQPWMECCIKWSRRFMGNGALALNDVSHYQLLFLDPPGGIAGPDLQGLIQAWHQQAHIHALDNVPHRLIIVLPRFHVVHGQVKKNKSAPGSVCSLFSVSTSMSASMVVRRE